MIKKIALLALIVSPFAVFIYLTGGFMAHYSYLVNVYFNGMESTYTLGCYQSGCMDAKICHERGVKMSDSMRKALEPLDKGKF